MQAGIHKPQRCFVYETAREYLWLLLKCFARVALNPREGPVSELGSNKVEKPYKVLNKDWNATTAGSQSFTCSDSSILAISMH